MAIIINEQRMVDDNTFLYEEKIKSPTSRFLDSTPIYVTYYHINNNESTADDGFNDIDELVGRSSPLRFNKIEKFPMYGMDQIVLQIQDGEAGIDSSYESDGIILPGTIKPLINDYFIIPILKDDYVFRVTNITYDNVMPDNFYKIDFKLEYIDGDKIHDLENQKIDEYVCVLENIGTDTNCIIEKAEFTKIKEIEKMYNTIIDFYKAMFYNERHNVFMCQLDNLRNLYDPLQAEFINKHSLFKIKNDLSTMILTDQYDDSKRMLKYSKSIYKYIEMRDHKLLSTFRYNTRPGITIHESSFYRWHDKTVDVLDIPTVIPEGTGYQVLSDDYVYALKYNSEVEGDYATLMQRFVRGENLRVKDIPLNLDQELVYLNNNLEVFFFTPIIMYIIRTVIKNELELQKNI